VLEQASGRTCGPVERGAHAEAGLLAGLVTLWETPMLEQLMRNCSLWEGPTLEQFVEHCLLWEGPRDGTEEEWEEVEQLGVKSSPGRR